MFMRVQRMLLVNFRGTAAATCDSEVLRELPEDPWVNALRADLESEERRGEGGEIARCSAVFTQDPQQWCSLWRSFPGPWKELVPAVYKGVVESGTAEAPVPEEEVQCPQCERWFGSMGAPRSHSGRPHGKRDQLRRFVLSAECPACSQVFPSRARALHHA